MVILLAAPGASVAAAAALDPQLTSDEAAPLVATLLMVLGTSVAAAAAVPYPQLTPDGATSLVVLEPKAG